MEIYNFLLIFVLIHLQFPDIDSAISDNYISKLEQICPNYNRCSLNKPTNAPMNISSKDSCCLPCSCDVTECIRRGNCCPDLDVELGHGVEDSSTKIKPTMECVSPAVNMDGALQMPSSHKHSASVASLGVSMVTTCPLTMLNSQCIYPNKTNIIEYIPVTSVLTNVTYRNIFCALCNGENDTDVAPWRSYVTCSHLNIIKASEILFPNSVQSMFRFVTDGTTSSCGFNFIPADKYLNKEHLCFEENSTTGSCPNSFADKEVRDACATINMPYLKKQHNSTIVYANYFCYLCNEHANDSSNYVSEHTDREQCPHSLQLMVYTDNEFVAELNTDAGNSSNLLLPWAQNDLTPPKYTDGVQCGDGTLFDPFEEKCRRWYCPSQRQYVNGHCLPIVKDVIKATYTVALKLRPDVYSEDAFKDANKTELTLEVLNTMYGDCENIKKTIIVLSIRDDFSYLYAFVTLKVSEHSVNLTRIFDRQNYGNQIPIFIEGYTLTVNVHLAVGVKIELSTFPLNGISVIDFIDYVALKTIYRANFTEIEYSFKFTSVTRLAFCSQILLTHDEIRDYIDVFDIRSSDTRIHIGEFSRTTKSEVRVCIGDYLRHVASFLEQKRKASMISPQAILSVVCNMLSMAGLAFTIVTYIIFDELRSVPGKNNMMLALHLLIAQCLYQFGMDRGEHPELCKILGIFIHMFWLIAIFWMNACTLHMFRTFVTGQSYRSVRACDPQVCCYAVYCYSIAIAMVAVNIGVSLYRSDGEHIGYGGHVCYISNPVMVGWVFALPVGVIIILNMGFFFAVVYQISASTMRRRGKSTDRANTVIYMKLSSLTGVTWIFGYLYLWTDFTPLEYIFIVLNAGQGVFIFISFICTQRITKLYRNWFRKGLRIIRIKSCKYCCMRAKSFESEANVVEMNTAKVSLTADTTTKRFTFGRKKPQKVTHIGHDHLGSKSDSISEVQPQQKLVENSVGDDVYQESAQIAHALMNLEPTGDAPIVKRAIDAETLNSHVNGGVDNIATIDLHQIEFIPTKNAGD